MSHQEEALEKLHLGAILRGGVGSGKTITSLEFYKRDYKDIPLYVITTAMKRDTNDWQEEAKLVGVEIVKVDSWNNIRKYSDISNSFFIFDEQGASGYGAWARTFIKIAKKNKWIMLSATPGDVWMDYVAVFIANGFFKHKTDFTNNHVVYNPRVNFPQVLRYLNTGYLEKLRRMVEVRMERDKHTTRHRKYVDLYYSEDIYKTVEKERWNIYEDRPIMNASEYVSVIRRVVNSTPDRRWHAKWVISNHDKIIVYYNFNYELDILKTICMELGKQYYQRNGQKHDPVPEGDDWVYLIQYMSGSEGWNCTTTNVMMFYSMNYSYRIHEQCEGRIDRLNTPYEDLEYYYLRSNSKIDKDIHKAIIKKGKFNEGRWAENWQKKALS